MGSPRSMPSHAPSATWMGPTYLTRPVRWVLVSIFWPTLNSDMAGGCCRAVALWTRQLGAVFVELQGDASELERTEIASRKYRLVHANTGQGQVCHSPLCPTERPRDSLHLQTSPQIPRHRRYIDAVDCNHVSSLSSHCSLQLRDPLLDIWNSSQLQIDVFLLAGICQQLVSTKYDGVTYSSSSSRLSASSWVNT